MKTFRDFKIFIPTNAAGEVRVVCPDCTPKRKHKNEKDLSVNVEKGTWYCQHCGWSGGLRDDLEQDRSEPKVYVRPSFIYSELPDEILEYFRGRGIHQKTLSDNKITAVNKAIKFPYFKAGECVNIKTRTLDKKFYQEKNPEPCLYRFDEISQSEEIIICEGEMDALSCYEIGLGNATSVPNGAPAPNAKNYAKEFAYLISAQPIFDQCRKVILAVDNDAPGKVLEQELARRIGVEKCYRVKFPDGCKDANDVLAKLGKHALLECIEGAKPYPVDGIFTPADISDLILHLYDCGDQRGVSTGWLMMDQFYTVKPGQMSIVTGIPGSGKSAWIDALMVNLAVNHSWTFAVFSPENWPIERHAQSIIEKLAHTPFHSSGPALHAMRRKDVVEMIDTIDGRFFFIMPNDEQMTVNDILDKARVIVFRYGVKGLVIDPWNELTHNFGQYTETQYISETLGKIRRFARRNNVHIWIVAHPQKLTKDRDTGKYRPPTMYEISGGANWRNKADVGICVHRPDMNDDITHVYIQKVRFREVGKLGAVTFKYARNTGNYNDTGILGGEATKGYCDTEGYQ